MKIARIQKLFAGVKAQQRQIDKLAADVEAIKLQLNISQRSNLGETSIGSEEEGGGGLFAVFLDFFEDLGVKITQGVVALKNLTAEMISVRALYTEKLCVEDVCINEDNLKQILQNAGIQNPPAEPAPAEEFTPSPANENGVNSVEGSPPADSESFMPPVEPTTVVGEQTPPEPAPSESPASEPAPEESPSVPTAESVGTPAESVEAESPISSEIPEI